MTQAQHSEYVHMQYGKGCLTTFERPSGAHCIAVYLASRDQVEVTQGFIRPEYLEQIYLKIDFLGSRVSTFRL